MIVAVEPQQEIDPPITKRALPVENHHRVPAVIHNSIVSVTLDPARPDIVRAKEFTVTIEDKPGALGKCFRALGERGINILACQSYVEEGESLARVLVDDTEAAKAVLGGLRAIFEETEVAVVSLSHKPGELGRAASRLGEHGINIDYSYFGMRPCSTL